MPEGFTSEDLLNFDFTPFDPLADLAADELLEGAGEDEQTETAMVPEFRTGENKTPEERMTELFESMKPFRKQLLGILGLCEKPTPTAAVAEVIEEFTASTYSVYPAESMCIFLEKAGGLERVDAQGQPINDEDLQPKLVEEDGLEYLEPAQPIEVHWVATALGREAYEADNPLERALALIDDEHKYAPIYERILDMCSAVDGATTQLIDDVIDEDPLLQEPRYFATRFVGKLEDCDAVMWKQAWHITATGCEILAHLRA